MGVLSDLLSPRVSPARKALEPLSLLPGPRRNPFDVPPAPDYLDVPFGKAVSEGTSQHLQDLGTQPETARKLGDVFSSATQFIPAVNQTGTIIDAANSKNPADIWAITQAGMDVATGGLAGAVKTADEMATPQLLMPEQTLPETMAAAVEPPKVTGLGHASPHDFDKFEWSPRTFGTGEGAQAFGHGLYAAENPKVYKENYGKKFTTSEVQLADQEGNIIDPNKNWYGGGVDRALDAIGTTGGDIDKAIEHTEKWVRNAKESGNSNRIANELETLDLLKHWQYEGFTPSIKVKPANIYEVELLADPEKFLDLDAPISEQMHIWEALDPDVRKAVDDAMDNEGLNTFSDAPEGYTGKDLYRALQHENVHESLPEKAGTSDWTTGDTTEARHTSEYLRERGIPGSKFKDAFSRKPRITLYDKPIVSTDALNDAVAIGTYFLQSSKGPEDALQKLEQAKRTFPDRAGLYDEVVDLLQSGKLKVAPPTRNYIAFSDDIIKIVKKNGIAMALAAGIITSDQAEELYAQGYE